MSEVDTAIAELAAGSDIKLDSIVYAEIKARLSPLSLNLAFFVFTTCARSHCARRLEDGQVETFPVLTLYLRYNEDFTQSGIDRHAGNWDDRWEHTDSVKTAVNAVLQSHKYGSDYVSDRTFIFVDSLERIAFDQIGRTSKGIVRELVRKTDPELKVAYIFWSSQRRYHIILEDRNDYKRVQRTLIGQIMKALPQALAAADPHGYCQTHEVTIELGHSEMDLSRLMRED